MKSRNKFNWLWRAYAVSTFGTWFGFGAFSIIALQLLHASAWEVSLLSASGLAAGALLAIPLGPWVEFRRKRAVMISMDLARCMALISIPFSYMFHALSFEQMVVISIITATADIAFNAASGSFLKGIVKADDLIVASGRFESTHWLAAIVGPPLGGIAIGSFGPLVTVVADSMSYLLSALSLGAIRGRESTPAKTDIPVLQVDDLLAGWRYILRRRSLRALFFNTLSVNALIMAPLPLISVLMLSKLGFEPWEYCLVFALPCVGGILGARLSPSVVTAFGQHRTILVFGALRICWPLGLAFVQPGITGILLVLSLQFCLVLCMGVFNPVFAAYRLNHIEQGQTARVLTSWSVTNGIFTAALTVTWGILATVTNLRVAIAIAGILLFVTPILLLKSCYASRTPAVPYKKEQ